MSLSTEGTKTVGADHRTLAISVDDARRVSGLLDAPLGARAVCVVAHGAGAGMSHPFMEAVAKGLSKRNVAAVRFQFPYMEQGSRRPDVPALAQATVRAAVSEAGRLFPGLPLFAGGKSFGGRMSSQAQAASGLPGIRGLVFFGFPLHPPGRPSTDRAKHLFETNVPMLFLQGTRDELAGLELLQPLVRQLGNRATLKLFEHANHSFHVPVRTGRTDAEIMDELLDAATDWMQNVISGIVPQPEAR